MIEYLDLEDLIDLSADLGAIVQDPGLVESAAARPRTTVFGEDAYPTLELKAAALLHSIVMNHPLVDGNKRLAWTAAVLFLNLNGHTSALTQRQAADLVLAVIVDDPPIAWIASELSVVRE